MRHGRVGGPPAVLAGVLLGLAVATKFYPLLFFGPLLLLCLRAGRMRAFWAQAFGAAVAWLAVNLPVAFAATVRLGRFYTLSRDRGADWGSVWYFFENEHWPVVGTLPPARSTCSRPAVFAAGLRGHRRPGPGRPAPAPGAAALLPLLAAFLL